jgi:transposase
MPSPETKRQSLKSSGTFNPRADRVRHSLFQQGEFFDSADLVQVKYETLRALRADGYSISQAATDFGLSRPTIYQAQMQFELHGMEGLLPQKRGPKRAHKLTQEVLTYLQEIRAVESAVGPAELARRVLQRFQIAIHPRTIEKALKAGVKRGRQISS